jgi:hypothetical protein
LITSTDVYKKVFQDVMINIFGRGANENLYRSVRNEDRVRSIGEAIDNIIRTQTLFDFSHPIIQES